MSTFPSAAETVRFGPPRTGDNLLIRNNLLPFEARLAQCRLTLCVAPAGYGKTTLLVQWYRHRQQAGGRAIWISLTAADADPLSFIALVDRSLRQLLGADEFAEEPLSGVAQADTAAVYARQLQRLQALMSAVDEAVVLFLDNYHEIDTAEMAAVFDALLQHGDAQCHFVVSSRTEPAFRHTSLLLSGRAQQFDSDHLKLSQGESADYIARSVAGKPLSDEEVALIYARTEGWPIAVQLCCLLANKYSSADFLRDFSGRDVDLGHFLNEQVFGLLGETLQRFAARVALFDHFNAELCDAALGQTGSAALIAELLRQKLFIYSLDRNGDWYRFHQMFREFLLGTQWHPDADSAAAILSAAARWSRERNRYVDAIDYAVRARNYSLAGEMLVTSAQTIVRDEGLLPNLLQWSQRIPVEDSVESVNLRYWTSWSLAFSCRYAESEKEIRQLEKSLADSANLSREQLAQCRANIAALKVAIRVFQDHSATAYHASNQWLAKYRRSADPFHVSATAGARFLAARLQLDVLEAKRAMALSRDVIANAGSVYGMLWIVTLDSLCQMEFGDYRIAEKTLLTGYQATKGKEAQQSVIHSTMALMLAHVTYEQGDSESARVYLREGYLHIMDHGLIETAAAGLATRCYLEAERSCDAALAELQAAEYIVGHYPPRLRFILGQLRLTVLVNAGRLADAMREAQLLGIAPDGLAAPPGGEEINPLVFQQRQVLMAKLLLLENRCDEARDLLQQLLAVASTLQRPRFHVELLLLDAFAQMQMGDAQPGCRAAMKAATIAAQNGLYRVLFECRHFATTVMRELAARRTGGSARAEDRLLERVFAELNLRQAAAADASPNQPLTRRERELLQLLETGLSVQALADHLFVSKATVKWHLYNLYGKIGVRSRAGAVAWARQHPG